MQCCKSGHNGDGDKRNIIPMLVSMLSIEDKRKALRAISLVNKKRCGKFKGRVVVDGRKQQ